MPQDGSQKEIILLNIQYCETVYDWKLQALRGYHGLTTTWNIYWYNYSVSNTKIYESINWEFVLQHSSLCDSPPH